MNFFFGMKRILLNCFENLIIHLKFGSVVDSFLKKSSGLHSELSASPDPAVWLFSFTLS